MRVHPIIFAIFSILIFVSSCSEKPSAQRSSAPDPEATVAGGEPDASLPAKALATSAVDKDHQACFMCEGKGMAPCHGIGCVEGKTECPGACMRLSKGKWERMTVAGHGPDELWQKFYTSGGGYQAWNQAHVGEVVVMQAGKPVNIGQCPKCSGATKVACAVCGGKGQTTCEFCEGKKVVPAGWTANDNPVLNRQPDLIRLKDGRALLGRVASHVGTKYTIRTRDGWMVEVELSEIVPKTNTGQKL
jgi:hypothetical protein